MTADFRGPMFGPDAPQSKLGERDLDLSNQRAQSGAAYEQALKNQRAQEDAFYKSFAGFVPDGVNTATTDPRKPHKVAADAHEAWMQRVDQAIENGASQARVEFLEKRVEKLQAKLELLDKQHSDGLATIDARFTDAFTRLKRLEAVEAARFLKYQPAAAEQKPAIKSDEYTLVLGNGMKVSGSFAAVGHVNDALEELRVLRAEKRKQAEQAKCPAGIVDCEWCKAVAAAKEKRVGATPAVGPYDFTQPAFNEKCNLPNCDLCKGKS